jgi:hypothetical protein
MVLLKEEAGKASLRAGKTSLAIDILNLCDSRSFCLKFGLFISNWRPPAATTGCGIANV